MVKKLTPFVWITLLGLLTLATAAGWARVQAAEPTHPVAVLSVASVDRLLGDLAYVTKTAGRPEASGVVQLLTASFVENMDRTKPSGVIVTLGEDQPVGLGFLPIKNLDKLLANAREQFGAEVEQLDDGIKRVGLGKGTYIKQQGPWLFFSDHAENLTDLPTDPEKLLDGLFEQYDIALRFNVQNVPRELRQMAIDQLEARLDMNLGAGLSGDSDVDLEVAEQVRSHTLDFVKMLVNDSDQLTLGLAIDAQGRRAYVDVSLTTLPGSDFATQLSGMSGGETCFSGIGSEDAAISFLQSYKLSANDIQQVETLVKIVRAKGKEAIDNDDSSPEQLKGILDTLLDVALQTGRNGKLDLAGAVILEPGSLKFVGGVLVADGHALEEAFKEAYELAKHEPDVPDIKFHAEQHGGIDLHTFSVAIPEHEAETRKALGDKLDVVIGTGKERLYLAFGDGCVSLLKQAIDKSADVGPQKVPVAQVRVSAKPLLQFLGSVNDRDQELATAVEAIQQASGGDQVSLKVAGTNGGVKYRLEIQEGVLEMIGKTAGHKNKK